MRRQTRARPTKKKTPKITRKVATTVSRSATSSKTGARVRARADTRAHLPVLCPGQLHAGRRATAPKTLRTQQPVSVARAAPRRLTPRCSQVPSQEEAWMGPFFNGVANARHAEQLRCREPSELRSFENREGSVPVRSWLLASWCRKPCPCHGSRGSRGSRLAKVGCGRRGSRQWHRLPPKRGSCALVHLPGSVLPPRGCAN